MTVNDDVATSPTRRRSAVARPLMIGWLGVVLFLAGSVWDGLWHGRHPGEMRSLEEIYQAHLGYWLGVVVLIVAGFLGPRRAIRTAVRYGFLGLLVGGVLSLVGMAWDSFAHVTGGHALPAHLLNWTGLGVALVALITATVATLSDR